MAKGFRDKLQKKMSERQHDNTAQETTQDPGLQERDLALPTEQLDQRVLKDVARTELEPNGQIIRVPIEDVYAVEQVRPEEDFEEETLDGLVQSYNEVGILSPPRCFPRDKRGYRLWFGETRWRSEKKRGEKFIDIYVGKPPKDDRTRIVGQLIENIHQSGIKPMATALAMLELKKTWNMSQAEIAKTLGKPPTFVSKHMRLLDAPEMVSTLLKEKVTKDLDMLYTLSQISNINPGRAEKLANLLRDGKLSRGGAVKELNLLKGKPVPPPETSSQGDGHSVEQTVGTSVGEQQHEPLESEHFSNEVTKGEKNQTQQTKVPESKTVSQVEKDLRIMVSVDGEQGYLLLDKAPEEFGLLLIKLSVGEVCVEAKEVTILGIKEV